MSTYEGNLNCDKCRDKYIGLAVNDGCVVVYEMRSYELVFFTSPYLTRDLGLREPIKTYPIKVRRVNWQPKEWEGEKPEYWGTRQSDVEISCPLCGEFTLSYAGVPEGVDVYSGEDVGDSLIIIPFEAMTMLVGTMDKGEQLSLELFRNPDLIKGEG